ncbi:MAG: endonuclease MutS2 [bacterium]
MIDEHTLHTLEFHKIIAQVNGKCLTPYGKEIVAELRPRTNNEWIEQRLGEVSQMKDIINFATAFPLVRMEDDCRPLLLHAQTEGIFLDPIEILIVLELVNVSIDLNGYNKEGRENFPLVASYLEQIRSYPDLRADIIRTIDIDGQVKDSASAKLRSIRAELSESRTRIMRRLQMVLSGKDKQTGWQDDVVTLRNNRYVIPVPTGRYEQDAGIIHDRSQSGATLYVEPNETVDLNNRIHLLMQQERLEIDRILRALTAEIARRADTLLENVSLIGHLDCLHASAAFSNAITGNQPQIVGTSTIKLVDARHPLLMLQFRDPALVIPSSLVLGESPQAILVTGPNTGGKTIILKAIGLAVLMARSGLHIAADAKSEVGCFGQIHADIGDEQSIELSLSTFSSHLANIIRGLKHAAPDSLLLFDEIGAGTDPKEGAALAEAVILYATGKGTRLVASTHYSQLKTLAMEHPEIENASLEFDRETLSPTYRLHLGLPGSSYAIEIASRLGLDQQVCDEASRLVGSEERSLDELVAQLEEDLKTLKIDRKELAERLEKARQLEEYYHTESERLKTEGEQQTQQMLQETEAFLAETRKQVEHLVSEIRRTQADKNAVREFHEDFSKRQKEVGQKRKKTKPKQTTPDQFEVGDPVRIISLDRQGEIEKLIGSDRASIRVGNVITTVEIRNLAKMEPTASEQKPRRVSGTNVEVDLSPEIHLLGMTGEEALQALEQYLDRVVMVGLHQVYVVHGKGTGALRKILTQYLKQHSEVASLRLGNWNEGGAGVTVVKMKH